MAVPASAAPGVAPLDIEVEVSGAPGDLHPAADASAIYTDLRPPLRRSVSQRACAKLRRCARGNLLYFDPLAIVESLVAITSGIVVWMGLWDLIDVHIMPDTGPAKLTVVLVSLVAVYANRTLYDKELLRKRAEERERRKGGRPSAGSSAHGATGAGRVPAGANGTGDPPVERSESAASAGAPNGSASSAAAAGRDELLLSLRGFPATLGLAGMGPAGSMRRLYFDAPPFSAKRFARASFALISGLTLWIGMWDLLDYHVITTVFKVCAAPVQWQCAIVKAVMVLLGLFGLYVTRSLYGEEHVKSAHFQRMT